MSSDGQSTSPSKRFLEDVRLIVRTFDHGAVRFIKNFVQKESKNDVPRRPVRKLARRRVRFQHASMLRGTASVERRTGDGTSSRGATLGFCTLVSILLWRVTSRQTHARRCCSDIFTVRALSPRT